MATPIAQKLYLTNVGGLPSLQLLSDISQDPNANYLKSQFTEVTSPEQLRQAASMAQNYYAPMIARSVNGSDPYYEAFKQKPNTFYGVDIGSASTQDLFNRLQQSGYLQSGVGYDYFSKGAGASQFSNLTPQEQQQYGFQSPFVQTSSLTAAQQQAEQVKSGQLASIGTLADGSPALVPTGSPAHIYSQTGIMSKGALPQYQGLDISIPQTIDGKALSTNISKEQVLQRARAIAPKVNLEPGMRGEDVKQLQQFLIDQGYAIPDGATGFYGEQTKAALTKFQQERGVQAGQNFGYYGPLTRDAISKMTTDIETSIAGTTNAQDATTAANNVLRQNGAAPLNLDLGNMAPQDVSTIYANYLNQVNETNRKIEEANAEIRKIMSNAARGGVAIQGQLGTTQTMIGRQLQNLKEVVTNQVAPYKDMVESLTSQLGIQKDSLNSVLAYAKLIQDMEAKPIELDLGDRVALVQKDANGQYREVASFGVGKKPGSGSSYGGVLAQLPTALQTKLITLASSFGSSDIVKRYNSMTENINAVMSVDPKSKNPADHQQMIYAFAKGLDPDSAVKEGEYETIKKYAQALIATYGKEIQNAVDGTGFLSEKAIKNIQDTMTRTYEDRSNVYKNYYSEQSRIVNNLAGTDVASEILTDYSLGFKPPKVPDKPEEPVAPEGQQEQSFFDRVWNVLNIFQ